MFYHNPEVKKDADNIESLDSAQLISGLFSAIQTMAESTLNEDVTLIELNKSILTNSLMVLKLSLIGRTMSKLKGSH